MANSISKINQMCPTSWKGPSIYSRGMSKQVGLASPTHCTVYSKMCFIKIQISGLNLHVFTLKKFSPKKLVFPP